MDRMPMGRHGIDGSHGGRGQAETMENMVGLPPIRNMDF